MRVLVVHELGHAVCATALGLTVSGIQFPTLLTQAEVGDAYYGRKAATLVDEVWIEGESGAREVNLAFVEEVATVAVAGFVAESLIERVGMTPQEILSRLRQPRGKDDLAVFRSALSPAPLTIDTFPAYIGRAEKVITPWLSRIASATPSIVETVVRDRPDLFAWADLAAHLGGRPTA